MDIYIRVSQTGDRSEEESTEVYEAQCREWATRNEFAVDEVVEDTDVSGSVKVADRGLGRLIKRVESGESEGILTPYLDRFGRDLIEGALAYKRIADAGGRLVCVRDGLDSDRQGDKLQFNIRMAFAEDYLDRVKENWDSTYERMIAQGIWPAPRIPFGYEKGEDKGLHVVQAEAGVVKELFRRRADGENVMSLLRWMRARCEELGLARTKITRTGVRTVLANEAYLGTTTYARGRKDNPIVKTTHEPLVTPRQWEAAQIKHPFSPRNGRAASAKLRGLVFCATCGRRLKVSASGRKGRKKAQYVCTSVDCSDHPGILAEKLDGHVDSLLTQAAADRDPHVGAILTGDTRYQDAHQAVEDAKRLLDEFRDDVGMQETLGRQSFAEGLKVRKEALELARQELRKARPPKRAGGVPTTVPWEEAEGLLDRERFQRYVQKVVLRPSGGKQLPAEERADTYWIGSDEPYSPTYADLPAGIPGPTA